MAVDVGMVSAAWKLRAGVYGLLVAVAALVLAARPSEQERHVPTADYSGRTSQGTRLEIMLIERRFHTLNAAGVWASCKGRPRVGITWSPRKGQANLSYWQQGSYFTIHERPYPGFNHPPGARVNLWLRGNLDRDARRIDGVITYFETGARGNCASGPIHFGISR